MSEPQNLVDILRSFSRGVLYLWLRSVPVSHARGIDPMEVSGGLEDLCLAAVGSVLYANRGRQVDLTSDDVQRIQARLLDDIVMLLSKIFYGTAVAA